MLPDGNYQLDVPYGKDWELIQDILKQGPDVEVLSPDGLRQKVMQLVQGIARMYGGV